MAGTRTAPAVNGTPTFRALSITGVDTTGDQFAVSFRLDPAAADADIEAFVAAYQAATQSSIHRVSVSDEYRGAVSASNANAASRDSVFEGVNMLYRAADYSSETLRVIAPDNAMFVQNSDIYDATDTLLPAVSAAYLAIVSGAPVWESQAYTKRSETNRRTRR